jgi:peptide/nickel transport system substrate-binding protein
MKARVMRSLLFVVSMVVVLAVCGGAAHAARVAEQLIVLTGTDASTFDPHFSTDSATELFNKNMYGNLTRFNVEMQIEPNLALSWSTSDDGLQWTFNLRPGVTFHDGTKFTAHDVKASFERILDPGTGSPRRSVLIAIREVEVKDDLTVVLHTHRPAGALLQQLAHPVGAIISRAALETYGRDLARNPVGSGPFRFREWRLGEEIVMERFEDYHGGAPMVQTVRFRVVPEDSVRAMLLQAGQADIALWLPVSEVKRLSGYDFIESLEVVSVMTHYYALNCTRPGLDDVRVRKALNYALDMDLIVDHILEGQGEVADAPLSKLTWGYSPIRKYPYDLEKAKALLAEAGYPDGIEFVLWHSVGRYLMDVQINENVQAQWALAGINVRLRPWEFQALMQAVMEGVHDMVYLGWSPSTGDADQALYATLHGSQWVPQSNRALYRNDRVDYLLDAARIEINPVARHEMYREAMTIIKEEAPWVFMFWPVQVLMHRDNIDGLVLLSTEHLLLGGVTKR